MPLKAGCDIIPIVMKTICASTTVGLLLYAAASAHADYVLVLKNGRQITVQSYREEGSMIKFTGLGGEIGISKEQIETVRKTDAGGHEQLKSSRTRTLASLADAGKQGLSLPPWRSPRQLRKIARRKKGNISKA